MLLITSPLQKVKGQHGFTEPRAWGFTARKPREFKVSKAHSWLCPYLQGSHPCLPEALLRHRQAGHSTAVAPSRPARAGLRPISSTAVSVIWQHLFRSPTALPLCGSQSSYRLWRTASPVGCHCVSAVELDNSDIFPAEKVSPASHVLCHMLSLL